MTELAWVAAMAASWLALWLALRAFYIKRLHCARQELARYRSLAHTDPLTGAGNRRAFEQRLAELKGWQGGVSLASLDLNGLKTINDLYGHVAGDRLLRKAAGVLTASCAGRAEVYRIGGDEFCLVAAGLQRPGAARLFGEVEAALVREAVDMALGWEHLDCAAEGSIEMLCTGSDRAMYRAKRAGKGAAAQEEPAPFEAE